MVRDRAQAQQSTSTDRVADTVNEYCHALRIGRTLFYSEVKARRIRVVKAGRKTLVPPNRTRGVAQAPRRRGRLMHTRGASPVARGGAAVELTRMFDAGMGRLNAMRRVISSFDGERPAAVSE